MKEQEKFDDIIRSKFEGQEFSFSEEHWEKAERMIDSKRKNKKAWRFALVFLGGLLAGILIMLPFVNNEKLKEEKMIARVIEKGKTEPAVQTKEAYKENTAAKDENAIAENKNTSKEEMIQNNTKEAPVENTIPAPETKKKAEEHNAGISLNENMIAGTVIKKKDEEGKTEIKNNFKPEIKPEDASVSLAVKAKSKTDDSASEIKEEKGNLNSEIHPESSTGSFSVLIGMNAKQDSSKASEKIEMMINSLQIKIDSMDVLIAKMISADSVKTKQDSSVSIPPQAIKKDTSRDYYHKQKSKSFFSASLGINYVHGWYTDTVEARGYNPAGGFFYTHPFNEKISISGGVLYNSINHLTQSNIVISSDSMSFGMISSITKITTSKLHYVSVPLSLGYNFSVKNKIYAGALFSYLFQSSNSISTYQEIDGSTENISSPQKTSGYYKAFNGYDAGAFIGFRRRVYNNWGIAGEVYFNFMDVKKDEYFNRKFIERNKGTRLMLTYDFNK